MLRAVPGDDDPAVVLFWDTSHLRGDRVDATLRPFPGWESTAGWLLTRITPVPEPIVFDGDLEQLRATDFPVNDQGWPVMSRRMLAVLSGLGAFAHRAMPVSIVERRAKRRAEPLADRFVAVQLLEHVDAPDWSGALPPLFRLGASPEHLLISRAARGALVAAGIRGAVYWSLATTT